MFDDNRVKEQMSLGYMQFIATKARCACEHIRVDCGSVDLTLKHYGKFANDDKLIRQTIDIQMKATSTWKWKDGKCAFDLEMKNYDELRQPGTAPAILVVYLMPDDENQWIEHCEDWLLARHCAYWCNLNGARAMANKDTRRVYLPKRNVLSPEAVEKMMRLLARGEELGYVL